MTGVMKLTAPEIERLEKEIEAKLIQLAVAERVVTKAEDAVVRDLLPKTDFGFPDERWRESVSALDWAKCISGIDNDRQQIICFYGGAAKAANPLTVALKFTLGPGDAKIKDIWQIESIYANSEMPEFYVKDPVIYHAEDTFSVYFYGKEAGTDELVLKGKIVEKKGRTIVGPE